MTEKISRGTKHNKIVDELTRESATCGDIYQQLSTFPFVTLRESQNKFLCRVIGQKEIRYAAESEAVESLVHNHASHQLTYYEAKEIVKLFIAKSPSINTPVMIDYLMGNRWTFRRLDFDAPHYMGCPPTFQKFLDNCTNGDALASFIGSIFVHDSNRHQYVWMYGQGRNGKSSVMRFLARLLGSVACTAQPEYILKNNFGTSLLMGKRICMFPDTNNHKFVMSGLFKSLTGGDQVKIERKGEQAFNAELPTKFMISSNDQPCITAQQCDMRRIIFCELGKPAEFDPMFEDMLWDEREDIIGYCVGTYHDSIEDTGEIKCETDAAENIAKSGDYDTFEQIIAESFIVEETPSRGHLWVTAGELRRVLEFYGMHNQNDRNNFIKHLKNVYNVTSKPKRRDNKLRRVYTNLVVRDPKMTRPVTPRNEKVVTRVGEHLEDEKRNGDDKTVIVPAHWQK